MSLSDVFANVFWHKTHIILSSCNRSVCLPAGSGLEEDADEPFHLSLLTKRVWTRDNFWYLALLPRLLTLDSDPLFAPLGVPFKQIAIERRADGLYQMNEAVTEVWSTLEYCVVTTYNLLKTAFLPLVPFQTRLPPYPRSAGFHLAHKSDIVARQACHRARRLFLGWLSFVAACIAVSENRSVSRPPTWYRALANETTLPPFWLDCISRSAILTDFSCERPRRGFIVNMCRERGYLQLLGSLHNEGIPMWLCFPHGVSWTSEIARQLYPSSDVIARAKDLYENGAFEIDMLQDVAISRPAKEIQLEVEEQEEVAEVVHWTSLDAANALSIDLDIAPSESTDALTAFFRKRKQKNDRRDLSLYSETVLHRMRRRVSGLRTTSAVYEWVEIEEFPWYTRVCVAEHDRERVWNSYQPHQRVYDEYDDEWDCVARFSTVDSSTCAVNGCRDPRHDHNDELDEGEIVETVTIFLPSHLRDPITLREGLAALDGESFALSFDRSRLDSFLDVLKYRYGLRLPTDGSRGIQSSARPNYPKSLLEALRAMVHEDVLNEDDWQDQRVLVLVDRFHALLKTNQPVPEEISDCDLKRDEFYARHNSWGLSIRELPKGNPDSPKFIIGTLDGGSLGWVVGLKDATSVREVLRRGWGPGNVQIARGLLERGISFSVLWLERPRTVLASAYGACEYSREMRYRPGDYAFKPEDYKSYVRTTSIESLQAQGYRCWSPASRGYLVAAGDGIEC